MIKRIKEGSPWVDGKGQLILNPVSTGHFLSAYKKFNYLLKLNYPKVFESYMDYIEGESDSRLLGDIHLVQISKTKVIMNGFVYKRCRLDLIATAKVLIELCNLGVEYDLNVSVPLKMNHCKQKKINQVEMIVEEIFKDFPNTLYLYENQ